MKQFEDDANTLAWRYKASPYSQQWFATTSKEIAEMYDDAEPLVSARTAEDLNHEVENLKTTVAGLAGSIEGYKEARDVSEVKQQCLLEQLGEAQQLLRRASDVLEALGEGKRTRKAISAHLSANTESEEDS